MAKTGTCCSLGLSHPSLLPVGLMTPPGRKCVFFIGHPSVDSLRLAPPARPDLAQARDEEPAELAQLPQPLAWARSGPTPGAGQLGSPWPSFGWCCVGKQQYHPKKEETKQHQPTWSRRRLTKIQATTRPAQFMLDAH